MLEAVALELRAQGTAEGGRRSTHAERMFSSVLTCVNTDRPETTAREFRRFGVGLALPGRVEPGAGDQSLTAWAGCGCTPG
jgi:hypothetical protein